jgi:hypothetical protein
MTAVWLFLGIFFSLLIAADIGRRIGKQQATTLGHDAFEGLGTVDGAAFAMLTLLIAFSFSSAATRFELRRQLIVQETNAIGTAYLRLDLLPEPARSKLRQQFGEYVDARLAVYENANRLAEPVKEMANVARLQNEIWTSAVTAAQTSGSPQALMLVVPALNAMIDITTTRAVAHRAHTPTVILVLLLAISLICSALAGHALGPNRGRSVVHMFAFVAIVAIALFTVIDYEFPRAGLIRIDPVEQVLKDLRHTMP